MKLYCVEMAAVGAGPCVGAMRCDAFWYHVSTYFVFVWSQKKVPRFSQKAELAYMCMFLERPKNLLTLG